MKRNRKNYGDEHRDFNVSVLLPICLYLIDNLYLKIADSVFGRGYSEVLLEGFSEMSLVTESDFRGDDGQAI